MHTIEFINRTLIWIFLLLNVHQFFYLIYALLHRQSDKNKKDSDAPLHCFAILIAARNESAVIGNLIDSIRAQDYPTDYVDVYVVADNCTDTTASIAALHGATVFERQNHKEIGKGYALKFMLDRVPQKKYDAFLVFDADNLLAPNYITEMNRTFSEGHDIITSYRNSKNYGDNWISAGYALWFLREARYLNAPRTMLKQSAAISGTGFLISRKELERCGGWHYHLLVEDIQFTIDRVTAGEKIGCCPNAVFYDEQPTSFSQSWRQRLRWTKGYLQVLRFYGLKMIRGVFKGNFSCWDMLMSIAPSFVLSATGIILDSVVLIKNFLSGRSLEDLAWGITRLVLGLCTTLFIVGVITTITEWKNISCKPWKKIWYMFTFPVYMFTYLPIAIAAIFQKVEWKPIVHTRSMTLEDVNKV